MGGIPDENVPHEHNVDDAIDDQLARTSNVGVLANVANSVAAPTQAEFNALVASHNSVLQVLRDAELIPSA